MTTAIPADASVNLANLVPSIAAAVASGADGVAGTSVSLQQLQQYIFTTKYARFLPDNLRRETYDEAVGRVFAMHERRYGHIPGIQEDMHFAKEAMLDRLVLGSQRAMQFGGSPIEEKHARLYNCTVSYCDRPRFFQESEWLLLCGCGVGFSVQAHHIAKLPAIARPSSERMTYTVPDTIEGWSDALGVLVSSYFTKDQPHPAFAGKTVDFDFSQIRAKGVPVKSGKKAPGPEPLRRSLEKIRAIFDARLASVGTPCQLRSIDAYDIVMHGSDAVLSGGTRRSATICIFSPEDAEMAQAKTGNWFTENPQRGRSNNSALLLRDKTSKEQFVELMRSVRDYGEPGFVWADSTEVVYNPCVEIGLYPRDNDSGRTGWAFCNLCEINIKACRDEATFARATKAAAILGTIQAGYTSFPYLGETTERIVRRDALLGVSMTGMMDNPAIAFDPEMQRRMANRVLEENARMAAKLGINPAARSTCVKPAGTTSCILGTSSGIHPHHSMRYFRRVQGNTSEPALQYFKAHNGRAVEKSVWNPNGTDEVLTFCIEVPSDALTYTQIGAMDLLSRIVLTQQNWVSAGRREDRGAPAGISHNVSNTIQVASNEWGQVTDFIFDHRAHLAGVSLVPSEADLKYPQAPFVNVWAAQDIVQEYGPGAIMASGLIVDGIRAWKDDLWAACDVALGMGKPLTQPVMAEGPKGLDAYKVEVENFLARKDWVRRAHKFATNYFGGDVARMTYCLKRVQLAKMWEDLTREYQPVDYTLLHEGSDKTASVEADTACAGGACQLGYAGG